MLVVVAANAFSAIIAVKGFLPPLLAAAERSRGLLGPPPTPPP